MSVSETAPLFVNLFRAYHHGDVVWKSIKAAVKCEVAVGSWVLMRSYPDKLYYDKVHEARAEIGGTLEQLNEDIGRQLMIYF